MVNIHWFTAIHLYDWIATKNNDNVDVTDDGGKLAVLPIPPYFPKLVIIEIAL